MLLNTLLFLNLGGMEWVVIIAVILLLFGGKKIPELMRGLGSGIREFNDAKKNVKDHIEEGMKEPKKTESKETKENTAE
jgi:sec-independent protein translocase protein TatA